MAIEISGDERTAARDLEINGNIEEATKLYGSWLRKNPNHEHATGVLLHAAALFEYPFQTRQYLLSYLDYVPQSERSSLYARVAGLEVSLGLLTYAVKHFEKAVELGGNRSESWKLQALSLRFSMGEYIYTAGQLLKKNAQDKHIASKAGVLSALSLHQQVGSQAALTALYELVEEGHVIPATWFEIARLSTAILDEDAAREALKHLKNDFPGSLGLYMAQSRIMTWISPERLMHTVEPFPSDILQIGVFSSREAATNVRQGLEKDGFTAWLEQQENVWKVVVYNANSSTLSLLAAKGYEFSVRR